MVAGLHQTPAERFVEPEPVFTDVGRCGPFDEGFAQQGLPKIERLVADGIVRRQPDVESERSAEA